MKRGKKATNGVTFVQSREMKPFLQDIKTAMKDLHMAMKMYEIELIAQGYTEEKASVKAIVECLRLKDEIIQEDAERTL